MGIRATLIKTIQRTEVCGFRDSRAGEYRINKLLALRRTILGAFHSRRGVYGICAECVSGPLWQGVGNGRDFGVGSSLRRAYKYVYVDGGLCGRLIRKLVRVRRDNLDEALLI